MPGTVSGLGLETDLAAVVTLRIGLGPISASTPGPPREKLCYSSKLKLYAVTAPRSKAREMVDDEGRAGLPRYTEQRLVTGSKKNI
eukprot:1869866-Rhodomonas_salina.1